MYPIEYSRTMAPSSVPMRANRTLKASACSTIASGPSQDCRTTCRALPARIDGKTAMTPAKAGTEHSVARTPLPRGESNGARRTCRIAPTQSAPEGSKSKATLLEDGIKTSHQNGTARSFHPLAALPVTFVPESRRAKTAFREHSRRSVTGRRLHISSASWLTAEPSLLVTHRSRRCCDKRHGLTYLQSALRLFLSRIASHITDLEYAV